MNNDSLRAAIVEAIVSIAPDTDAAMVSDQAHLLDDLGLDSMDFLNLVATIQKRLGVTIEEIDFPRLTNVAALHRYISGRRG